jgi:predicted  nucleic acid-binding Zn-ribbon protein
MERISPEQGADRGSEEALAALAEREAQIRRALIDAHDQLLRRDEEIEDLRAEVTTRDGEVAALREEVGRRSEERTQLQVRLDGILSSPPMRAYALLTRLPGFAAVRRRRQARFESALAQRTNQGE